MKKVYQITGTDVFGATKQELKPQRDQLNRKALNLKNDQTLEEVGSNKWPHRITKGPEHPNLAK